MQEIEQEIAKLSPEHFLELAHWVEEQREAAWERQMEAELASGQLDREWAQAQWEIETGETTSLDEFLRHP